VFSFLFTIFIFIIFFNINCHVLTFSWRVLHPNFVWCIVESLIKLISNLSIS
jgi:hypothetical protein